MNNLIFLSISVIVMLSTHLYAVQHEHPAAGVRIGCNINAGPCAKTTEPGNIQVIFDINPKPVKPMKELFFRVDLKEGEKSVTDAAVNLDLTMPGMFMGINRPVLKHIKDGRYEGQGILPKCPHGGKTWKTEVTIMRHNKTSSESFIFEVE